MIEFPDTMPLPSAAFSGSMGTPTQTTQFTSGRIRRRALGRTPVKKCTLEWLFTPDEYDFWVAFHEVGLNNGCDRFTVNMVGGGPLQSGVHTVQLIGDYDYSHEECNWRVTVECIIHPFAMDYDSAIIQGYLGGKMEEALKVAKMYYDEDYQL